MDKLKLLELFGGIGACSKALERLGIDYEIADYVEIDKYAVASYNAMHGTNFEPQDICEWDKDIDVDLIMHGSPCQDFSLAGLQAGGDKDSGTRSSLMYETIRIVKKLKPKYVIWENVKNLLSKKHIHNFTNYLNVMEELGYTNYYQIMNARDYGIPQNRERVFTVSVLNNSKPFVFPQKEELKYNLKDFLDLEVDKKYYLSDRMINYISQTGTENYHNNNCKINLDIARPLTTCPNKRAGTTNYIDDDLPSNYDLNSVYGKTERQLFTEDGNIKRYLNSDIVDKFEEGQMATTSYPNGYGHGPRTHNDSICLNCIDKPSVKLNGKIRRLTPKECWRLMGFDDSDFDKAEKVNSNSQLYKQAGNSIVVNVLEKIFKKLLLKKDINELLKEL